MDRDPAWHPDRLLKVLLIWTSVTTLIFWLPTVRGAFDGDSYEWSVLGFSGRGISEAYWLPFIGSSLSMVVLWLGWRGARSLFKLLLGAWHSFLTIGITVVVQQDPEGFHLQGDTMGMDLDLAIVGPALFGGWTLLAYWWILRDFRRKPNSGPLAWTKRNKTWLLVLVAVLPVQFTLLRTGAMESPQDQVGVLLTVLQWLLLGIAFAPRKAPQA